MSEYYPFWREKKAIRAAFPVLFRGARHPWKIGIWQDIISERPEFNTWAMKAYLRLYTHGHKYLSAVVEGRYRIDLSGVCIGQPTEEHIAYARNILDKRAKH